MPMKITRENIENVLSFTDEIGRKLPNYLIREG